MQVSGNSQGSKSLEITLRKRQQGIIALGEMSQLHERLISTLPQSITLGSHGKLTRLFPIAQHHTNEFFKYLFHRYETLIRLSHDNY